MTHKHNWKTFSMESTDGRPVIYGGPTSERQRCECGEKRIVGTLGTPITPENLQAAADTLAKEAKDSSQG